MTSAIDTYPAVPCNGCTRCCRGDRVRLTDDDDPSEYLTEPHEILADRRMLAHKKNGECIYLKPSGCGIYERRPKMCRSMDCRNIARRFSFTQARKLNAKGVLPITVWQRGKELLGKKP